MTSKQRRLIVETLLNLMTHPTADELYVLVRKTIPNISLGTVYRNLNKLIEEGEVVAIENAGYQRRFDIHRTSHYHLRCKECGRIYDIPMTTVDPMGLVSKEGLKHHLEGFRMCFYGVCEYCFAKEEEGVC